MWKISAWTLPCLSKCFPGEGLSQGQMHPDTPENQAPWERLLLPRTKGQQLSRNMTVLVSPSQDQQLLLVLGVGAEDA